MGESSDLDLLGQCGMVPVPPEVGDVLSARIVRINIFPPPPSQGQICKNDGKRAFLCDVRTSEGAAGKSIRTVLTTMTFARLRHARDNLSPHLGWIGISQKEGKGRVERAYKGAFHPSIPRFAISVAFIRRIGRGS